MDDEGVRRRETEVVKKKLVVEGKSQRKKVVGQLEKVTNRTKIFFFKLIKF